jgi:hypothetical protein
MPRNRNFYSTAENMEGSLALRGDTMPFDPATQHDEDAVMQISTFQNNFVRMRIPLRDPGRLCGPPCRWTRVRAQPRQDRLSVLTRDERLS